MSTPILPLAVWASGTNQNSIPANDNALRIEALSREIISLAVTAQPGSPADGDTYIIASTHTGAMWAGFSPKDIAIYRGGTWYAWAPTEGVVVNVAGALYKYDGAAWVAATTSGMSNPMTTAEDIITGGASGTPARLAVGTNGQVLSVAAGAVAWATPSAGFVNPMTTAEDLIKGGASGAAARLAVGSNGQVLTVTAGAAGWATPSAGFSNPMTTTGDVIYSSSGSTPVRLGVGSSGQVMTVAAGVPSWATPASGFANPMTTVEDIIKGGASGAAARLAVGSNGHVLTVTAGAVGWAAPASGFTNPMTTIGDVIVGNTGGAAIRLANGTAGYVLTAVAGAPPAWSAPGGGALTNWTEAVNSAAPNASTPVVSFAVTNAATNVDAVLKPKGTGAVLAAIPDSTAAGGNKRGQYAVDHQVLRAAAAQVASNTACVVAGGDSNTASGTYSAVLGGKTNIASGSYSAIGGGLSNTGSAYGASVTGGEANTANTGDYATITGGYTNTATGFYAIVTGGSNNTASGDYSRAGGNAGTTRGIRGADVFGAGLTNSQGGKYLVRCSTTDATPKVLTASGAAASAALIIALPNTSVFTFSAVLTAKASATDGAGWKIEGVVQRGASAATTAFIGTPVVTALGATAGAAAWAAAAVVDTTNGGFTLRGTGAAATNINWTAYVTVAEA